VVPERWYIAAAVIAAPWRRLEDDAADLATDITPSRRRALAADIDREAARLAADTHTDLDELLAAVWTASAPGQAPDALTGLVDDTNARVTATAAGMGAALAAGRLHPASARIHATAAAAVTAAHNLAALNGYRAAGIELAVLHDGPGCGLTDHDDPQDADGLIVPLEVAAAWPLSHPHCARSVDPYTGPAPAQLVAFTAGQLAAAPGGFAQFLTATPPAPTVTGGRAARGRSARAARTARTVRTARTSRGSRQ
jgi:hypothetical protein